MADKTYAQLTEQTDLEDGDLLAAFRTAAGVLKRFNASVLLTYLKDNALGFLRRDGSNTMTGQLQGDAGSVGSPGYGFDGDSDTGVYRIGANNAGLSAGGVKQAEWDATGFRPATAFALLGDITPSQITSDQNDYNPTGLSTASILRLSSDAARALTGLQGGSDGRVLHIYNVGSFNITLTNASASSSAANRFDFGASIVIGAGQGVILYYDSTASRWHSPSQPVSLPLSAASGGTGVANNAASTITVAGNFALTVTLSGTTGVTLPESGTLVAQGGALGTPSSGTLTNCTGLPVATGISGLGSGVATFLATPSSANFASAVTGETGSGAVVFATSPSLTTPNIGAATGMSLSLSGSGLNPLTTTSTDASASAMVWTADRNSASPAAADGLLKISSFGRNASAATIEYTNMAAVIVDTTAGSEDGRWEFATYQGGSLQSALFVYASTTGIRFPLYGAGTLTTSADGTISATSDARLKDVTGQFSRGLADLSALAGPVLYRWKREQESVAKAQAGLPGLTKAIKEAERSVETAAAALPSQAESEQVLARIVLARDVLARAKEDAARLKVPVDDPEDAEASAAALADYLRGRATADAAVAEAVTEVEAADADLQHHRRLAEEAKAANSALSSLRLRLTDAERLSDTKVCRDYVGWLAQDVEKAIPEAVSEDPHGFKSLNDRAILAAAVNAIVELNGQLEDLRARVG